MSGQIRLSDGSSWEISAGDERSRSLLSAFKKTMQLRSGGKTAGRLLVVKDTSGSQPMTVGTEIQTCTQGACTPDDTVVCSWIPADDDTVCALQLRQISLVLTQHVQHRGGLLLHGALAEWNGNGVILAGRAGIGKTTASQRFPLPWKSLSDDLTLVVRDAQGKYLAHPWPTWSRFLPGRPGGSWDVQYAVPLKKIFFLTQSPEDRIETIGRAHAVGLLNRSWSQARFGLPEGMSDKQRNASRLKCFDTMCRIVHTVPCSLLHVSLQGMFWQNIEKAMPT